MDLFRRKQKLIFWIVTLIIVPSFVLVWGVGDLGSGGYQSDFEMGKIGGRSVRYQEYGAFSKRIQAALGGMPFQFNGAPGTNTPSEELWKFFLTYTLLQDAERAGARASDLQVGTYLENTHPTVAPAYQENKDRKALERAVDSMCAQLQITRQDFLQGVREWQTIRNYLDADANLAAVNDSTVFSFYALNKSEVVIKRVRIAENDAVREQAKKEIMEKPEEELRKEVRAYAAAKGADPRNRNFREPARWRFVYLMIPFGDGTALREPSPEEIDEYYTANRTRLYADKPLAEVEKQVKTAVRAEEAKLQTLRNYRFDIDPQLRGKNAELPLAELVKLTPLAKYGATFGDTGAEALPPAELLKKLPEGVSAAFVTMLENMDEFPETEKTPFFNQWKSSFLLEGATDDLPFMAEKGLFRLRLVEYLPSAPAAIDDADGNIKSAIYEAAVADLVGERAGEIVAGRATEMERNLRALLEAREKGEEEPDATFAAEFGALPTETIAYLNLAESDYQLGRLAIGDLLGPKAYKDDIANVDGQEIVVLTDRRVPTREAFAAESFAVRNDFRQLTQNNFRGGFSYTYSIYGPTTVINPGPTIMGSIADRVNKGEIIINQSLFNEQNNGEG